MVDLSGGRKYINPNIRFDILLLFLRVIDGPTHLVMELEGTIQTFPNLTNTNTIIHGKIKTE